MRGFPGLRESEVEHLHHTGGCHFDVRRFQIAVNDACFVCGLERVGDLLRDRTGLVGRQRTSCNPLGQRRAPYELHREGADRAGLLHAVDLSDVRVVERREGSGLTLETQEPFGVVRDVTGQHLESHVAVKSRIARAIHLAHPAGTEQRDDLVRAEPGARR